MKTYRITLQVQSAFGTPLVGDSLFGQFCWAITNQFGQQRLTELLQGYSEQQPFAVFSDAFPTGYLPLPHLPSNFWQTADHFDRKALKKKQWIGLSDLKQPVSQWQLLAKAEKDLFEKTLKDQPHNSISRKTGSTGNGFSPYMSEQIWYQPNTQLDIYLTLDESRLSLNDCLELLKQIGLFGYGRDASIGLGKFAILQADEFNYSESSANVYLTLANCAPQNLGLDKTRCYYQITTRFGRHGNVKALSANPFKKPIILAKAGAVFSPQKQPEKSPHFLGNGLKNVSYAQDEAVHQGYAPVIPVYVDFNK